jgi:AraC-like DNA-binding protein
MKIYFNIFNILILIGCVQGILLSLLLLRNNAFRKRSNVFLALMIISFSFSNFRQFLIDVGLSQRYPLVWFMPLTFGFLIPVAFYFFVQHLIASDYRISRKSYYLLLAPFLIHFIFQSGILVLYLSNSPFLAHNPKVYRDISVGMEIGSIFYCFIFIILIFSDIAKYERKLRDNFSAIDNKTLSWLRNLMVALSCLWILWGLPYLYEVFTNRFLQWHHYPLWIGMSIVIYWIGYSAYSRADVFQAPVFAPLDEPYKIDLKLSDKTEEYHKRLIEFMRNRKLYLNPELSLDMLAKEMDISAGYLSQIINKVEKVTFYEFINKYRVEEAKIFLNDPAFNHYTILAIGMEAGFNSKSTFNTAFKKYSGTTPSAFKDRLS